MLNLDIVPVNYDECIRLLSNGTTQADKDFILKSFTNVDNFVCSNHMAMGLWIRNNFSLWEQNTPLVNYFNSIGLYHADDISSVILKGFYLSLKGENINLNDESKKYKQYWDSKKISFKRTKTGFTVKKV